MTLAPGSRLGPYEITGPIGAGGMGEVYRARDSRLDRDVAIKVLPENVSTSPSAMERFGREAKAIAALSHPGILSIHDFGTEGRTAYAVTELLEGETLEDRLAHGALTPRKSVEFAVQIATALASAHERGVIHRDLKPANLFITRDGRVKILDFGLARLQAGPGEGTDGRAPEAQTQTRHTASGVVLGTAGYMSPEQVRGQPVDHRTDIFALGCVMYEMLTGRRAFQRETSAEAMTAVLREDPVDPATFGRPIPQGLDRLMRRCLEKRPEDRLQSARDLAIALDAVSLSETSTEKTAVAAPSRRMPRLAPIAAAAVAAALVLAALAYQAGKKAAPSAAETFPRFTKLTFRRGHIAGARFSPDGRSVLYSASWDSGPMRVYTTVPESAQASTAALHEAMLLGVSPSNELAIMLKPALGLLGSVGTLARAPMGTGAPRPVLEGVQQADWSKDSELAVVRTTLGHARLEFPIGTVRYETSGWLSAPRLSPAGDSIAFIEHPIVGDDRGWPSLVDLKTGAKRDLAKEFGTLAGLAFRPDGRELCVSGGTSIYCLGMNGGEPRRVYRGMSRVILEDISADGRILVTVIGLQGAARAGSSTGEVDLGDTPAILPIDIDPRDGRVLFESLDYGVYIETPGKGPAVRLGDGIPLGLSPDGAQVLNLAPGEPTQLTLIPTGVGSSRPLERGSITRHTAAVFAPDGKAIVISGAEKGHGTRLYIQDLAGGDPRPISADGVRLPPGQARLVSPDGRYVAAIGPDRTPALYPLAGGEPRPIPGADQDVSPIGWTDRPGVLFASPAALSRIAPVFRLDVATGRREPWREFGPADRIGSPLTVRLQVTPDGSRYAYLYFLSVAELVLIDGIFDKEARP